MHRIFLVLSFCFSTHIIFCQEVQDSLALAQVDQQVWIPFMKAYKENDVELYNSIHTDDVLRITPWGIRIGDEYKNKNIENFARPNQKEKRIDFRFQHRVVKDSLIYDVGYYKLDYFEGSEISQTHYGRFHVLLKKENGTWKIAQDWDSADINGHKVGEEDWNKLNIWRSIK